MRSGIGNSASDPFYVSNVSPGGVTPPALTPGDPGYVVASQPTASALNAQVVGNVAGGAASAGNPLKFGGVFNSTLPTYTNGNQTETQTGARGEIIMRLGGAFATGADGVTNSIIHATGQNQTVALASYAGYYFNGTTWDRMRGDTIGIYVVARPGADAGAGIVPTTTVAQTSLLVKAAAGNLFSASMTAGATAGFFIAYNAASAPAPAAALTAGLILAAVPVATGGFASIGGNPIPDRFGIGIVLLFSTSTTTYTVPANPALHMRATAV